MHTVVSAVVGSPSEGLSSLSDVFRRAIVLLPWKIAKQTDPHDLPPGLTMVLTGEHGLAIIEDGRFLEWIDVGRSRPMSIDLAIDVLGARYPGRTIWVLHERKTH